MFDLAINTTLDPNPKLAAQALSPSPLCADFSHYPGKRGSAIFGLFGKEFPNLFALKFIRVNYVEVETIFSWGLRIQVSRNQSCDFLRDFSLCAISPGTEERRSSFRVLTI
ncbi:hypothetical protein V6N13_024591 [Hibiscus sabdariffa]